MKKRELPSSIEETTWRKEFPGRRSTGSGWGPENPVEEVAGGGSGLAGSGGWREEVGGGRKALYEPFTPTLPCKIVTNRPTRYSGPNLDRIFRSAEIPVELKFHAY